MPQREIQIGVPGYSLPADNRTWTLLSLPFRKQRAYWQRPEGTPMQSRSMRPPETEPVDRMQE